MALPGDVTSCVVTGTFQAPDGTPLKGTVSLTPSVPLLDPGDSVTIWPVSRTYELSGGSFVSAPLVSTDSTQVMPPGWWYEITVSLQNSQPYTFSAFLFAADSPLDISEITPVSPVTQMGAYVPITGGTMEGPLYAASAPSSPNQVATMSWVESITAGLAAKGSALVATAAALPANTATPLTLTANFTGALTVDGVAVPLNARVLVKNEVTAANNGIFVLSQLGTSMEPYILTRSSDMDANAQVPGAYTFVEEGTANAGFGFIVSGIGPYVLGTTAIAWEQFTSTGDFTAGAGLTLSGDVVSLNSPVNPSFLPAATTSAQGAIGPLPGGSAEFLRADGTWDVPPGSGITLAGDLGNTDASPEVVSTHLSSPLPLTQGGTDAGSAGAALTSLGAAGTGIVNNFADDQRFASGRPWFDVTAPAFSGGADPSGVSDSTAAFTAAILAATGSAAPATSVRTALGPVFIPAGTYQIKSDLLIQSTLGFQFIGAGAEAVVLVATGSGFTTAVINADGADAGVFGGFTIKGNGTESAGGTPIPYAINLTQTTAALRSTSACVFRNIRIRNLNFAAGIANAAQAGTTHQVDGTTLTDVVIAGGQVKGSWSDTGAWQQGFVFGNGEQGNQYDYVLTNCSAGGCYYGYWCSGSGFELYGAQPASNYCDFYLASPGAQVNVQGVQSQNAQMFITGSGGSGTVATSFRDINFKGWHTSAPPSDQWITINGGASSWEFSNVLCYVGTGYVPVAYFNGGGAATVVTLLNFAQQNTLSAGVVVAGSGTAVAVNYVQLDASSPAVNTVCQYWYYSGGWINMANLAAAAIQIPNPADAGYYTWTGDPFTGFTTHTASQIAVNQASGAICLTRLDVPGTGTVVLNGYLSFYWQQPTGGTPLNGWVGIYNSAGTQVWAYGTDLTTVATSTQRLSTGITSWTPGTYYVASLIGTQGSTAGGLAFFGGGLTLGTGGLQISGAPFRCSSLAGSATSLPGSLTFSSFGKTYYYVWAALD